MEIRFALRKRIRNLIWSNWGQSEVTRFYVLHPSQPVPHILHGCRVLPANAHPLYPFMSFNEGITVPPTAER